MNSKLGFQTLWAHHNTFDSQSQRFEVNTHVHDSEYRSVNTATHTNITVRGCVWPTGGFRVASRFTAISRSSVQISQSWFSAEKSPCARTGITDGAVTHNTIIPSHDRSGAERSAALSHTHTHTLIHTHTHTHPHTHTHSSTHTHTHTHTHSSTHTLKMGSPTYFRESVLSSGSVHWTRVNDSFASSRNSWHHDSSSVQDCIRHIGASWYVFYFLFNAQVNVSTVRLY